MPAAVVYATSALLILGAGSLHYAYYEFLRVVAGGVFVWAVVISFRQKRPLMYWACGMLALLFNPFLPIHLPKGVWMFADVASGLFLFASGHTLIRGTSK